MDWKGMEENGVRTRSFRHEDYNTRRVFLRSYPLHWGGEDKENNDEMVATKMNKENNEEMVATKMNTKKKRIKKIILSICHWGGGKVLVLRRFKHKFTIYIIACIPMGFKSPTALISA